ncbi:MAG: hypothetical protein HY900_31490 [Deltaproteobacteria bacterium]|nr:hypothetical protein [Deltaproteobacteria bacterium]
MSSSRILNKALLDEVVTAEEAASMIRAGDTVGMSGFTGAGYPKAVPVALAKQIMDANLRGEKFRVSVWTGASTAPELDGALAMVDGVELRLPYQSDPICRKKINAGEMEYLDIHLSHVGAFVRQGFLGKLDVALVEVTGVREDGALIPSSSIGNNKVWLDSAERVILEVNSWQSERLEGVHDVYQGFALPPNRKPIPLVSASDRIGTPYLDCPLEKIIAVVETNAPDRNAPFSAPDEASKRRGLVCILHSTAQGEDRSRGSNGGSVRLFGCPAPANVQSGESRPALALHRGWNLEPVSGVRVANGDKRRVR